MYNANTVRNALFRIGFSLLLWCQILAGLGAQNGAHPYFRRYSTEDGLPSPEVHEIIQDSRGYIWIGTDNGVCRFDGYSFKKYGAQDGLKNNVVFFLQEDSEGRIWMQTMSRNLYYFYQDSIYPYPYNHIFKPYTSSIPNGFLISSSGWSYFALQDVGIIRVDTAGNFNIINKSDQVSAVLLESDQFPKSLYSFISRGYLEKFGFNWFRGPDEHVIGVFSDTLTQKFNLSIRPGNTRSSAYSDREFQLFNLRKQLIILHKYQPQARFDLPASLACLEKIDSTLWLGFDGRSGIRSFDGYDQLLRQQYQEYLSGLSITAVCRDRLNGYWFGSLEKGIYYAPNLDLKVNELEGFFDKDQVLALEKWQDDRLLLGTSSGLLLSLDTLGRLDTLYTSPNAIFDLHYLAEDQSLWAATNPLFVLDATGAQTVYFTPELNLKNPVAAKRIHPSYDGKVLFGSSGSGLDILDIKRRLVVFTTLRSPERILAVHQDSSGRLWIGNIRGLFQFKDGLLLPPPVDHPVFGLRIEDIAELADSTLVLATKGAGVIFWKDSLISSINESHGLTANMIENLAVDSQQQIWVGTLNGLNILSRTNNEKNWRVKRLTMAHGLPSDEINDFCSLGNKMYVATSGGIVRLPLQDSSWAERPAPFLEKVLINGNPAESRTLQRLRYEERNIQLQFVCINYQMNGHIPYRYRLVTDTAWSFTENRSVNYAALAPGQYTFEVQAQNEDGIWSDPLRVPFRIAPPVWQQWWFIILCAGALIGFFYYQYRQRISRLEKEAAIDKEINELQRSALQAQMNPHFIFNCLNSIQNFIASGDKENAMQYLSRFAKLVRATLHASVQPSISLEEEIQLIENYLELEKLRFGNRFEYRLEVDPKLDHFDTSLPPLLVQPFVENAIIHGFNFSDSQRHGHLLVSYQQADEQLRITIRDNGIGIEQSRKTKVAGQQLRTSLGMSITEKRLALQESGISGQRLIVTELQDPDGKIAGTEVVIILAGR